MRPLHPALEQIAVFFEGRIAFKRGAPFDSCPCCDQKSRETWERGWVSAWEYQTKEFLREYDVEHFPHHAGTSGVAADQVQSTAAN
jgi:hypothetical protein